MQKASCAEKQGYWYEIYVSFCPVCCEGSEKRKRVYDRPKPVDYADRLIFTPVYDGCVGPI